MSTVWLEFKVLVFEPATVLCTVAKIFTLCPWKLAPKSSVKVLPVGEPPKENIASPSWLLPDKFKVQICEDDWEFYDFPLNQQESEQKR